MIRLALRQARLSGAAAVLLGAAVAAVLAITGNQMTTYLHTSGLAACLESGGDCSQPANQFTGRYASLLGDVSWLNLVPMLVGVFWGAPLLAREIEQHTHRFVWTQSITRSRWLTVKLGLSGVAVVLTAAALTWLFTWWYDPFGRIDAGGAGNGYSRMNLNVFDFQGTVLIGYTLYAFALGTAAGALIGRTVPAIVVTVTGFLGLRLAVQAMRGHLIAPLSVTYPFGTEPRQGLGDWTIRSGPIDAHGQPLDFLQLVTACPAAKGTGMNRDCVAALGIQGQSIYQPLTRFWALQAIETSIFLGAALLLLVTAVWWTLRRCR